MQNRPPAEQPQPRDDLKDLLMDRPPVPVTRQLEAPPEKPAPSEVDSTVVDRPCRVAFRPDAGGYLLTFLSAPSQDGAAAEEPRWILPSEWLARVEPLLAGGESPVLRVSGETTAYKGRAFILLRNAKLAAAQEAADPKAADVRPQVPAAEPAVRPKADSGAPGSPDQVMRDLLRDRPGKLIAAAPGPEQVVQAPSVAPAPSPQQLDEDRGTMRIDRLITIRPESDGAWWQATFESDNTLQDQPVRLLPCKLLERAEAIVGPQKHKTVRLRVTGEITRYKGRYHLLLRKVLREREMGQF